MTFKIMGAVLTPFTRIGGLNRPTPLVYTLVQTDGSFRHMKPRSRVAAVILGQRGSSVRGANSEKVTNMVNIDARSSTETEWASVAFGLNLALQNGKDVIALENDNLSVIHGLIFSNTKLKHEYARHYRNEIQMMSKDTEWTGVRWIPREMNTADRLF